MFHFSSKELMLTQHFAPVQGHTDAAYRYFHHELYGGNVTYYTPFIRWERNGVRTKDIKDITSDLNDNVNIIPQIIFRDKEELNSLVKEIKQKGYKKIDLNMGCPFPLQTGHGRGAATISNALLAKEVVECVSQNPDITFSLKMRLGMVDPTEWRILMPHLNDMKLSHVALHPRVAKQQYGGEVNLDEFGLFLKESRNPVIYNGDLKNLDDLIGIEERFKGIEGIMVGRGVLGRPSLLSEYTEGKEWDKEKRISKMLEFHRNLFNHYSGVLC